MATGQTVAVAAESSDGGWLTSTIAQPSTSPAAIAFLASNSAMALLRYTQTGNAQDQALLYARWAPGGTAAPAWSAFAQVGTDTTRGGPLAAAQGGVLQALFQGTDYHFYTAAFTADAGWLATAQAVGESTAQPSYGPVGAAFVGVGATSTLAFLDGNDNNDLTVQTSGAGASWLPRLDLASGTNATIAPSLLALPAGSSDRLFATFVEASNSQVGWLAESAAGTWSAAAPYPSAFTNAPVALVATATGAVAAFQGTDNHLYWSLIAIGSDAGLAAPTAFPFPNVVLASAPALAPGIGDATAELAYVDSADGSVYHASLSGGVWSSPEVVFAPPSGGLGLEFVTIATTP